MQQPPPSALVDSDLGFHFSLLTDHGGYFQKVMEKLNCRKGAGTPLKSCKLCISTRSSEGHCGFTSLQSEQEEIHGLPRTGLSSG